MSKPVTVKSRFIRPPVDGLNLISDPIDFKETEARQLDNYYIYDWGIRERGPATLVALPDAGYPVTMYSFTSVGYQGTLIESSGGHTYRYTGGAFTLIDTDYPAIGMVGYNKSIQICRIDVNNHAHDHTDAYSLTGDTVGAGVTGVTYFDGCSYKDRLYLRGTSGGTLTAVTYFPVGAIAGAADNAFEFGTLFQRGNLITFIASWTFNQGLQNEQLFVVGNDAGEVLIYSGDWPAASNWQLVSRLEIPVPFTRAVFAPLAGYVATHVINLGQDILINTSRGLISLAQAMAGKTGDPAYTSISRKIGPNLSSGDGAKSGIVPFAYFPGDSNQSIYVLNYERGAWSRFPNLCSGGTYITSVSCSTEPRSASSATTNPVSSYVLIGLSSGGFLRINESDTIADTTATYTYKSQFFDFGSDTVKRITDMRVLGRDMAGSSIANTVKVSADYDDSTIGTGSSATTTVTDTTYRLQKLAPASPIGETLSVTFTKTGSGTACNELSGMKIWYESGGIQ